MTTSRFVFLACLGLCFVSAQPPNADERRTQYQISLRADGFRDGQHLAAGINIYRWLESLSQHASIPLTAEPLDAAHQERFDAHYKIRERIYLDTSTGFFAQNGITLIVENRYRLDNGQWISEVRCRANSVTHAGALDQENAEAHVCFPYPRPEVPFYESRKIRLEEEIQGLCLSESRVSSRVQYRDREQQPFIKWETVSDAIANYPNLVRLLGIDPTALLEVSDIYTHFRLDDISLCLGDNSVCPPVNATTTSAEWNAVTRSNSRARLELHSHAPYAPDLQAPLSDIFEATFKFQLSARSRFPPEDYSWASHQAAENLWRENFIERPADNRGTGIDFIPHHAPEHLRDCSTRPFYPTPARPTLRKV